MLIDVLDDVSLVIDDLCVFPFAVLSVILALVLFERVYFCLQLTYGLNVLLDFVLVLILSLILALTLITLSGLDPPLLLLDNGLSLLQFLFQLSNDRFLIFNQMNILSRI